MKDQLQRAKQALEAEATVGAESAAAEADSAGTHQSERAGSGGAMASKAQQRSKKADEYHARHRDWVAEFNDLTGGECAGGDGGVKWAAVRAWQQKHWQLNNLFADGLVGPKTLEAAKLLAKKNTPKDDKENVKASDREDGAAKDKAAEAEPGRADGAESAADKPNLEADVDEQVTPTAAGAAQGPLAAKKQATLPEFEAAVAKLEALLTQSKQPQGEGPQKPIAQHYVEGTDDTEAPPALGAMMSKEVLRGYGEAAKKLETSWASLDQPHARAQFLLSAVNEALAAEQVPAITDVKLLKMANPGEFEPSHWIMNMNEPIFAATVPKNIAEVASQVFHEGRHAEQRFSIARLLATKHPRLRAEDLRGRAGVSLEVAEQAIKLRASPLSGEQAKAAEAFKHATVDNPAHKEIEQSAAAVTDAANTAAAVFRAMSPADQAIASARWADLRQRAIVSLDAYYQLATERDAYAAQKQLADANK